MRKRTLGIVALAAAAIGCCCGGASAEGEGAMNEAAGDAGVAIVIEAPERASYGAKARAKATLENRLSVPVALAHFALRSGGETVARHAAPATFPASPGEGAQLRADGRLLAEDIGPAARAPAPPRWEWEQTSEAKPVTTLPVVPAGGRVTIEGELAATEDALAAGARFVPIEGGVVLLRTLEAVLEPAAAPAPAGMAPPGGRWNEAARARVVFAPQEGGGVAPAPAPGEPLAWKKTGDDLFLLPSPPPAVFPYALAGEPAGWKVREASARRPIALERPSFDLADARKMAGIESGPATYIPAANAWALEGPEGASAIVTPAKAIAIRGNPTGLAAALNESGKATVSIFSYESDEDPNGIATRFRARGFEVTTQMQKGMTYGGKVEVTPATLAAFAEEAAATGKRILGLDLD